MSGRIWTARYRSSPALPDMEPARIGGLSCFWARVLLLLRSDSPDGADHSTLVHSLGQPVRRGIRRTAFATTASADVLPARAPSGPGHVRLGSYAHVRPSARP